MAPHAVAAPLPQGPGLQAAGASSSKPPSTATKLAQGKMPMESSATQKHRDEKPAVSALAVEEASYVAQQQHEQEERLMQERARKKIQWEQELQRELDYQKSIKQQQQARRSLGPAVVYPE
jgi:hypothetical protein